MPVGTTLTSYDTKGSPKAFSDVNQTPIQLTSTIGMLTVRRERIIKDNYTLQVDLVAEVKVESDKYVVVDYQVDEYGIGDSMQEAEQDLVNSLVDYLVSLERRQTHLGDRERHNLDILRTILQK